MTETVNNKSKALVQLIRPHQWVKNVFVLAPLLFSKQFCQMNSCWRAGVAFLSFCAVSSAIYALNDYCDRNEDKLHPVKKHRPVASGTICPKTAMSVAMILGVISLIPAAMLGINVVWIVGIYAGVHIAYSLFLKHVVIIDVMLIAAGFVLRILGGCAAIEVIPSQWIILCTIMISMYLGFTKRRAELVSAEKNGNEFSRIVLKDYSKAFLDQAITILAGATLLCYALYAVDDRMVALFGSHAMLLTVPSVMYGLLRYNYLIFHHDEGEDPTAMVLKDVPTVINLIVYVIVCFVAISYGGWFGWLG